MLFLNFISSFQPLCSLSVDGPLQTASGLKTFTFHHPETEGKSSPEPSSLHSSSQCPGGPSASTLVIPSRRLSSPEKIIDLHKQLQKTLISSPQVLCTKDFAHSVKRLQTPVNRGGGQEPRKYLFVAADVDPVSTPQRKEESLSFSASQTNSVILSAAPILPNQSPTFNNADAFCSADMFRGQSTNSSEPRPETTASDPAAPENSYFSTHYKSYGAAPGHGRPLFAATCTPQSHTSERKSSAAMEKSKMIRPKPGNT